MGSTSIRHPGENISGEVEFVGSLKVMEQGFPSKVIDSRWNGSAAGCEAVASPRRSQALIRWAMPVVRSWPVISKG